MINIKISKILPFCLCVSLVNMLFFKSRRVKTRINSNQSNISHKTAKRCCFLYEKKICYKLLSVSLSVLPSVWLYLCHSLGISVCLSLRPSVYLYGFLLAALCFGFFLCFFVCLIVYLSFCISVWLYVCLYE